MAADLDMGLDGWQPIETLRFDGREIIVGVWVDSSQGWRWSSWTTPAEKPLGCDGEWGDEPTHYTALLPPPPLSEAPSRA